MENFNIISDADQLRFEQIWIDRNVKDNYSADRNLSDDDRISFKIWEELYWKEMYAKHLPNTKIFKGDNPNIIFHGGCLGCKSQRIHGIDRCKGCSYFKGGDTKNLFIPGEDCAKMSADDFTNMLNGNDDD